MNPMRLFQARLWPWRLLVLEAMLWLALAVAALRLLPFRRLAPLLGPAVAAGAGAAGANPDDAQTRRARRIGAAVRRAARLLPGNVLCLPQAMAAKAMLGRRGIRACLHLGALPATGPQALEAHAWVTVGDIAVTGGADRPGYAELVRFG